MHGMQEVIGSTPIYSTKRVSNGTLFLFFKKNVKFYLVNIIFIHIFAHQFEKKDALGCVGCNSLVFRKYQLDVAAKILPQGRPSPWEKR